MKILVLGSNGQLGKCLNDQLNITEYDVVYTSRKQIDISNFEATKKNFLDISPNVVINATAYTAVDKAEKEHEAADLINHLAVANIAKISNQLGCWLIHISTDYVFDGNSEVPYNEEKSTNPQNVYGITKLKGEQAIQISGCKHIIIRTSWIFSEYGNNFLKTMIRLGAERKKLDIINDQIGCPSYAQDIAGAIIRIIPQLNSSNKSGIYHYCGNHQCSWFDFAKIIFQIAKRYKLTTPSKLTSIKTTKFQLPAKRPMYSVLNCSKIGNEFGVISSNWEEGINKAIEKIKNIEYS